MSNIPESINESIPDTPSPNCPYCGSNDTIFKKKAKTWECQDCEKRFLPIKSGTGGKQRIFLSYPHEPTPHPEVVMELRDCLKASNYEVWFDQEEIRTGHNWRERITQAVHQADWVLACLSEHSMRPGGVCLNEIGIALYHKSGDGILRTVLLEEQEKAQPPISLTHIQWLDLNDANKLYRAPDDNPQERIEWLNWLKKQTKKLIQSLQQDSALPGLITYLKERLQPAEFASDVNRHLDHFSGRKWLFEEIDKWLNDPDGPRVLWLKGAAGIGKSAVAAQLTHHERNKVIGCYFCHSGSIETHDASKLVRTFAFQLASRFGDYRISLLNVLENKYSQQKNLADLPASELWRELMANQLTCLTDMSGRERYMFIIDGLDEAQDAQGKNAILDLVANEFNYLPSWIGVLVTGRPEQTILHRIDNPLELDTQDHRNQKDVQVYLKEQMELIAAEKAFNVDIDEAIKIAVQRSKYNMQYANLLLQSLRLDWLNLNEPEHFPEGLSNFYYENLRRVTTSVENYREQLHPLLELIVAAPAPLPEILAVQILDWNKHQLNNAKKKLSILLDQQNSKLIPGKDGRYKTLALFHRSLADWLLNPSQSHDYELLGEGRQILADYLWECYEEKQKGQPVDTVQEWALNQWLPMLLDATKQAEDLKKLTELVGWYSDQNNRRATLLSGEFYIQKAELSSDTVQKQLAKVYNITGNAASALGGTKNLYKAIKYHEQSLEIRNQLYPSGVHAGIANNLNSLGIAHRGLGGTENVEKSIEYHEQSLDICRQLYPSGVHVNIANNLNSLGIAHRGLGGTENVEKSIEYHEQSLEIRNQLYPSGVHAHIAASLNNLGIAYRDLGGTENIKKVIEYYEQSLEICRQLYPSGVHAHIAASINNLGIAYCDLGSAENIKKAIEYYEQALDIFRKLYPSGVHAHIAASLNSLGNACSKLGGTENIEKSIEYHRQSLEIKDQLYPSSVHADIVASLNNLGNTYRDLGGTENIKKVIEYYEQSLEICRQLYPSGVHAHIAASINNLGIAYCDLGSAENIKKAIEYYEQALDIFRKLYPSGVHAHIAASLNSLGNACSKPGGTENIKKAIEYHEQSLDIRNQLYPSGVHAHIAGSLNKLGNACSKLGGTENIKKAVEYYEQALNIERQVQPEQVSNTLGNLSYQCLFIGKYEQALANACEALDLEPTQIWINANKAAALLLLDRQEEAEFIYNHFLSHKLEDGTTFRQTVLDGFVELREAGIDHSGMARIEEFYNNDRF